MDRSKVLFVDDSKTVCKTAEKILSEKYTVLISADGEDAWHKLENDDSIAIVFSDLQMPKINGIQLLEKIRQSDDDRIAQLPVIMITGIDQTEAAMRTVFKLGATDFISKPFKEMDLLTRAHSYIQLTKKVSALEIESGKDKLTGLNNLDRYLEQGTISLSTAKRHKVELSIIHIEIAGFKDKILPMGKQTAAQILVVISQKISALLRQEDYFARIGVDKFAIILPLTSRFKSRVVLDRIRDKIKNITFEVSGSKVKVDTAYGITSAGGNDTNINFGNVINNADTALKNAYKQSGEMVASYYGDAKSEKAEPGKVSDIHFGQYLHHISAREYDKIPEEHLQTVLDRLLDFVDHATKLQKSSKTA